MSRRYHLLNSDSEDEGGSKPGSGGILQLDSQGMLDPLLPIDSPQENTLEVSDSESLVLHHSNTSFPMTSLNSGLVIDPGLDEDEDDSNEGVASKRKKNDYVWEFSDVDNTKEAVYRPYDKRSQILIETAYQNNLDQVILKHEPFFNKQNYVIVFKPEGTPPGIMLQKNLVTNNIRYVRRVVIEEGQMLDTQQLFKSRELIIEPPPLEFSSSGNKVYITCCANMPFQPSHNCNCAYFEVKILEDYKSEEAFITIGLVNKEWKFDEKRQPGISKGSYGYSQTGFLYNSGAKRGPYGAHEKGYKKDDIIGCGVSFDLKKVFFTQNGKVVDTMPIKVSSPQMYAAVFLNNLSQVSLNFGNDEQANPFVYKFEKPIPRPNRADLDSKIDYYHVLLNITGGAWNLGYLYDDEEAIEKEKPAISVNLTSNIVHELVEHNIEYSQIYGVLSSEPKLLFSHLEYEMIRESAIHIEIKSKKKNKKGKQNKIVGIDIENQLHSLVSILRRSGDCSITQTWKRVPLKPKNDLPSKLNTKKLQSNVAPLLFNDYIKNESQIGWLDIELTIFHTKPKEFVFRLPPWPWVMIIVPEDEYMYKPEHRTLQNTLGYLMKNNLLPEEIAGSSLDYDTISASEVDYDPTLSLGREMRKTDSNNDLSVTQSNTLTYQNSTDKRNSLMRALATNAIKDLIPKSIPEVEIEPIKTYTNFITILPVTPGAQLEDLWLDDINSIAMLFHNVYLAGRMGSGRLDQEIETFTSDIFNNIVPEAFTQAFKIILGILWEDPLVLSVKVLSIVKQKISDKKPGNWLEVKKEIERIIDNILNYTPRVKSKNDKYYEEFGYKIQNQLQPIVKNELRIFAKHDSTFSILYSGMWRQKKIALWPLPIYITPSLLWILRFLFFILFLIILTCEIYSVPHTDDAYLALALSDNLNYTSLQDVDNTVKYWAWLNKYFLPGLYEVDIPEAYILADKILIRQVRNDPKNCSIEVLSPLITEVPSTCYQRLDGSEPWYPTSDHWKNTPIIHNKKILAAFQGFYGGDSYGLELSYNYTEAQETIDNFINDTWIDGGTQAVILEYLVYSANSKLFASGVILVEFSSVGFVIVYTDFVISDSKDLQQTRRSPLKIILILFYIGFIIDEIWDFIKVVKNATKEEKKRIRKLTRSCNFCYRGFMYCYTDPWNILDILMVLTGFLYILTDRFSTYSVSTYSMQEIWQYSELKRIADIFASFTVVLAYLRFLSYLSMSEWLGVLIITVFKMVIDVARFLLVFISLEIAFSSAYYRLYPSHNEIYPNFLQSNINVFMTTLAGYQIPPFSNLLAFPTPIVALIFQIVYVFIMLVLLLNLIIAILGTTYEYMQQNAKEEYRWAITRYLSQLKNALWPSPLNIIQVICAIVYIIYGLITGRAHKIKNEPQKFSPGLRINHYNLFSNIITSFFKNELGAKYEDYMMRDKFDDDQKKSDNAEEQLVDMGDDDEFSKLSHEQQRAAKDLLKGIVGEFNIPWILTERHKENLMDLAQSQVKPEQRKRYQIGKRLQQRIDKAEPASVEGDDEYEVRLTFEHGRISGQGNDNGPYFWDGTYTFEKDKGHHVIWKFTLRKKYFGRHTINYNASYNSAEKEKGKPIVFVGTADDGLQKWEFTLTKMQLRTKQLKEHLSSK